MTANQQHGRPKISVVTPSFNQGRFLEQCIRSVLDQDYPNLEFFILDGGSRDESVDVIRRYQDRITFWVSERDGGQSAAINKGFHLATGDLVAWLNADDFYLPGAFARAAAVFGENPDAAFYFGDGWRVDEAGKRLSNFFPEGRVLFHLPALLFGLNYILQPATFINRRHLVEIDYLNAGLKYGMDSDLWMRLAQLVPPAPISQALAASREYGTTKTATGSFERVEELRRISEKHSGLAMTPGVLCYFLDTLNQLVKQRSDVFPPNFCFEIQAFWQAAAQLMSTHGARPDGFPKPRNSETFANAANSAAPPELKEPTIAQLSAQLKAARQEILALRNRSLTRRLLSLPRRAFRLFARTPVG